MNAAKNLLAISLTTALTAALTTALVALCGNAFAAPAAPVEMRKAEPMVISAKRVVAVAEVRVAEPMVIIARVAPSPRADVTLAALVRPTAKRVS